MQKKKKQEHFNVGSEFIEIKGARTHNLKNIDVTLPRNTMIAITGLSGSGKSSLAFDTIFAEGQRRYVESLSAYARQFLSQMQKPDVDEIKGLSPAISIDQKSRSNNPRSTVATITEIYDYLRVLYARIGTPYSPISGRKITKMSRDELLSFVRELIGEIKEKKTKNTKKLMGVEWNETKISVLAPVVRGRKGEYYQLLYDALGQGFAEVVVDGELKELREQITLAKNKKHDIDLVVDSFLLHEVAEDTEDTRMRISEAIERALDESEGLIRIIVGDLQSDEKEEYLLSAQLICPEDGFSFPEIEPRLFSFNSPYGACPECNGLGTKHLFGNEYDDECPVCRGARLRPEALFVMIGNNNKYVDSLRKKDSAIPSDPHENWERKGLNIYEFGQLSISDAHTFILELELSSKEEEIAGVLLHEIESRLQFLNNVGLGYLSLDRRANTLSGGEAQRIRLASQLGSRLVGALYVLDEPTIGLHQKDNDRLIKTLTNLRDLGNTIIVVEHDEDTLLASDYIVDIGPGAGRHGGEVIDSGWLSEKLEAKTNPSNSLTLSYLRKERVIDVPETRRSKKKGNISVRGGNIHNIKNLDIDIPLGRLVLISGMSGSGKSSFMYDILYKNLQAKYNRKYRSDEVYNAATFQTDGPVGRAVLVDQSPIGRTPRSNPATYTGAWNHVRDLFSATVESQMRGWKPGRFSFNVKGGRCETCQGRGEIAVEMHFLPTVYVTCDVCGGKRFDKETLRVKYRGKNIHDVLEMTIDDAYEFFQDIPAIADRLKTLQDVGLGYLQMGQPANTLSGGESQRVKISSELYRPFTEKTVYLLDEPTVGLHFEDVKKLIEILNRLVDRGNSVFVIEHNLDVIKNADYVLDFGPEGGERGGKIVAKGTPENIANSKKSHTGEYLKRMI
jgi:excinuclease ABC subunit A